MDNGGIVPGPVGQATPIIAHGGETVLPTHKTSTSAGNNFNFDLRGATITDRELINRLKAELNKALATANITL